MKNILIIIFSAILLIITPTTHYATDNQTFRCQAHEELTINCLSITLLQFSTALLNARVIIPTDPLYIRDKAPVHLIPQVIDRYPHDRTAFTQGLVLHDGQFYESTGLYRQSTLRRVEIETGKVLQQINLPIEYFAEGLALVDNRLIQLTWRENIAFVYDSQTFEQIASFDYQGEGWGLCYDGTSLYMSNGTAIIYERDPVTFEIIRTFEVTRSGIPQRNLNELACVDETIFANIWLKDEIVQFNKSDGVIMAVIDASELLTPEEKQGADVLNGIVYDDEQDLYYVTGKNWPYIFLVDFIPKENGDNS